MTDSLYIKLAWLELNAGGTFTIAALTALVAVWLLLSWLRRD